ncbi:MAG: hypothetical protein QN162_15180 [Armatimonadota bacterium]|nr:hypothetical protein [Armatimonadota bacterium]
MTLRCPVCRAVLAEVVEASGRVVVRLRCRRCRGAARSLWELGPWGARPLALDEAPLRVAG